MRPRPIDTPKRRFDWTTFWFWVGGIAVVGIIVTIAVLYFSSIRTETGCVVDSKERTTQVTGGGKDNPVNTTQEKIVYTSCGVFTVDDNFFLLRFNSADTYGSLGEGETFDLEVIGWRNGFFSWFPNVLSATPSAE